MKSTHFGFNKIDKEYIVYKIHVPFLSIIVHIKNSSRK